MSADMLLQKIQDEQGFVVIWSDGQRTIGQVLPGLRGGPHGDVDHPTVVIGTATQDEFEAQRLRWKLAPPKDLEGLCFYKVRAE